MANVIEKRRADGIRELCGQDLHKLMETMSRYVTLDGQLAKDAIDLAKFAVPNGPEHDMLLASTRNGRTSDLYALKGWISRLQNIGNGYEMPLCKAYFTLVLPAASGLGSVTPPDKIPVSVELARGAIELAPGVVAAVTNYFGVIKAEIDSDARRMATLKEVAAAAVRHCRQAPDGYDCELARSKIREAISGLAQAPVRAPAPVAQPAGRSNLVIGVLLLGVGLGVGYWAYTRPRS